MLMLGQAVQQRPQAVQTSEHLPSSEPGQQLLGDSHQEHDVVIRPASPVDVHHVPATPTHVPASHQVVSSDLSSGVNIIDTAEYGPGLNPTVDSFQVRDRNLVHQGRLYPDILDDWDHVQRVQAGGIGTGVDSSFSWSTGGATSTCNKMDKSKDKLDLILPFQDLDNIPELLGIAPKQVIKVNLLQDHQVRIPQGPSLI